MSEPRHREALHVSREVGLVLSRCLGMVLGLVVGRVGLVGRLRKVAGRAAGLEEGGELVNWDAEFRDGSLGNETGLKEEWSSASTASFSDGRGETLQLTQPPPKLPSHLNKAHHPMPKPSIPLLHTCEASYLASRNACVAGPLILSVDLLSERVPTEWPLRVETVERRVSG